MNLLLTLATVALLTLSFAAPFCTTTIQNRFTPECIACVVQYHWQAATYRNWNDHFRFPQLHRFAHSPGG
ncbi:MAG: hypothetical protein R3C26_05230 [Calditrichia bacterium]